MADLLHQQRRQAEKRLVQQQHARRGHQRTGDRHHLLLSAGQSAGKLPAPFCQAREQGIDVVKPLLQRALAAAGKAYRAQQQVVLYRQRRKHAPPLGHLHQTGRHDGVRRQCQQVPPIEQHLALAKAQGAGQCRQQGGLAGPVRAKKCHGLAATELQADVVYHRAMAITRHQADNVKHAPPPPRHPDKRPPPPGWIEPPAVFPARSCGRN